MKHVLMDGLIVEVSAGMERIIMIAMELASESLNNAMEPALRKGQSVETICASAVRMTLTVGGIPPTTTEIATAPASA